MTPTPGHNKSITKETEYSDSHKFILGELKMLSNSKALLIYGNMDRCPSINI